MCINVFNKVSNRIDKALAVRFEKHMNLKRNKTESRKKFEQLK